MVEYKPDFVYYNLVWRLTAGAGDFRCAVKTQEHARWFYAKHMAQIKKMAIEKVESRLMQNGVISKEFYEMAREFDERN